MKKKFILLPMFLLVLAACGKTSSSETPTSSAPGTSVPGTSEVTTSEDPITSDVEESSDDLPPPPPSSSAPEAVLTTIEEARKVADGTEVTVEGVITAIYGMANDLHGVIIQEGDYAITLPFVDKAITAELEVGNVIQAKGKRELFNGLVQLKNSAITFKAAEGPEIVPLTLTEADWTIENLQTKDARWVKVEGLKYVSGTVNLDVNSPITVKLGNTELPIYMSRYIDMAEKEAIKTKIESIKSTDTITFVGPVGFFNTPQLNPVNAATITIVEGEGPVGPVLPTSLTFTPATAELAPGETFETTLVKAPSDATLEGLTYTSANEAVATVSETGVITAVDVGTTTITAQVGEVKAVFVVNVTIPTSEKLWGIDFKVQANWVRDDKEGQYYNYYTPYNVTLKDGDVEMDWILRGANPHNLVSEGVRFGGKPANAKLGEVITDGLPMGEELAAELAATYAQSKAPIVGEVSEVMINIGGDFGDAKFTREKVYLQASVDADFTNPIDLGSKDAVNGKLVFDLETALEDHYFRVIFGMKLLNTEKNEGLLVHEMVFSKALETEIPPIVEKQTVTFASALPAGWTYISNDPVNYPDLNPNQDWYKDGGFKFRFPNQALKTPVFTSTYTKVTISGGLNTNQKTDGGPTTIALYTINGSTETLVDSISFPADSANTYTKVFNVNPGANQFLIKMTGNVGYNVNLRTVIFE